MKSVLLLLAFGRLVAASGEEAAPASWSIRVGVQMVSLPLNEGRRVVPLLRRTESFAAGEARVQELLASGEAELLTWLVAQGISGKVLESQAGEEVRGLIEFAPPAIPQLAPPPSTKVNQPRLDYYTAFGLPPVFETRNTGASLKVDATVDAATGRLDLTLVVRKVQLEAMEPALGAASERPEALRVLFPRYSVLSVESRFSLPNHGPLLVGSFVVEKPQSRLILFLLRADAEPPPRSQP